MKPEESNEKNNGKSLCSKTLLKKANAKLRPSQKKQYKDPGKKKKALQDVNVKKEPHTPSDVSLETESDERSFYEYSAANK